MKRVRGQAERDQVGWVTCPSLYESENARCSCDDTQGVLVEGTTPYCCGKTGSAAASGRQSHAAQGW